MTAITRVKESFLTAIVERNGVGRTAKQAARVMTCRKMDKESMPDQYSGQCLWRHLSNIVSLCLAILDGGCISHP